MEKAVGEGQVLEATAAGQRRRQVKSVQSRARQAFSQAVVAGQTLQVSDLDGAV